MIAFKESIFGSFRLIGLIAVSGLLIGCSSRPDASVSANELTRIRSAHDTMATGTPKDIALKSFKDATTTKLSSATIDGMAIEEWKAEAVHTSGDKMDLFISFMYFANNRLAEQSPTRLDYRGDAAIVERWRTPAK